MITKQIEMITSGQPQYPALLKEIKNYPKTLYYVGDISLLNSTCAAVIGSRTTTAYGQKIASAIGRRLGERGGTVVSGMAAGIDAYAHKGALEVGGKTIAVLGCGVDVCYPPQNRKLKEDIEDHGLVISEFKPGTKAERYNFPQRNRIISGLSKITVVVQARNRSGALITAELAAEQGREVYAVPGNIDSQYNLGNNKLISEGAVPVISVDDLLEPLGLKNISQKEAVEKLSSQENQIFSLLQEHGEMSIDEICMRLGQSPGYVNPMISVMEMKGFVFSSIGKIFLAKV